MVRLVFAMAGPRCFDPDTESELPSLDFVVSMCLDLSVFGLWSAAFLICSLVGESVILTLEVLWEGDPPDDRSDSSDLSAMVVVGVIGMLDGSL